jgi:hypothetical protein
MYWTSLQILEVGDNTSKVIVKSLDGLTTKTYNLVITRADSLRDDDDDSLLNISSVNIEHSLRLYPNPTSGKLTIESSKWKIKTIEILDISGKSVKTYSDISSMETSIDVSELPKSTYFVVIHNEEGRKITRKFVKE